MKKFLVAVLAVAMVFSVCSFPVSAAEVPAVPDENLFYGIGASGFNISVDVTETSTVAHTAGNTITYAVTVTNRGGDITKGNHLKVQLYNTSTNLEEKGIFNKTKLDFPTHSPRFTIGAPTATGVICRKTNPTVTPDGQKFSYDYDNGVKKDLLMAAGASVTFNMSYTIDEDDIEQGYMRNLIVVYLGDTQGQYAVGKYVQAAFIDESVNVGTLTISNKGGSGDEIYTVRLADTYTTPPTVTTGITFVNGVATIRLTANGSVTGDVPAGDYTVTVSNAGDKDVSYTVDGGSSVTGRSYNGRMTMGGTCRIEFTFTDSAAPDNYHLTYHFNAPSGYSSKADVTRDQSFNEFTVEDVCAVFTDLTNKYYIEASGKTYYFCGWSDSVLSANPKYDAITYPVTDFSSSKRGFVTPGTFTVKDSGEPGSGSGDLYAVWLENPGLMGYSMAVQGGHFISRTQTGDQNLGDNGLSGNKAQKFVVYDGGHLFDEDHTDMLTATDETPTLSGYTFVTWFNKSAQRVYNPGDKQTTDPNEDYIVQPGDEFGFGDTSNIYSLDAVWGRVEGAVDREFIFDGAAHQIGVDDLKSFIWGASYTDNSDPDQNYKPNSVFKSLFGVAAADGTRQQVTGADNLTYAYTVTKNGKDVTSEATVVDGVPQFTEPGVYEYTIKAVLEDVDPTNGRNTSATKVDLTIGTVSATLTILPVESLTVTKYVRNGEDPDEEFTFSVSLSGVENKQYSYRLLDADGEQIEENTYTVSGGAATVTVALKDEESVVFDNLPNNTTYSVEETNLRTGYKQSDTGNKTGTITESNKEVTVVFTNTYETNDLTIGKEVPYSSDTTQFTFTVTLKDAKGVALPGSFVYSGSKEGSITSGGTVTLANGETVTIYDLPVGASYTVVETAAAGYITPVSTVTGTVRTAAAGRADFTNYKTGSLTVTKEFKLNEGIEPDNRQLPADWNTRDVTFRVTFNPPEHTPDFTVSYNGATKKISGESGGYIEFTLTKDTYTTGCTITGIPYGVAYEVLEIAVGGVSDGHYVPLYNGRTTGSGEMDADSKTVNCVNTYHLVPEGYGALVVKKDVVGVTSQTEFTFRVTFSGTLPRGFERVQTFTLKNGGYTLLNVPHGVSYVIEEVFAEGETRPTKILPIFEEPTREEEDVVSGETARGTITAEFSNDSVLFSNQYLSGMTVKKEVEVAEGSVGPDADKTFTLTVNFTGNKEYANLRVEYSVNGGAKNLITKPGSVTLTLKAGDTVRFEGVPVGASHIITEAESSRGDEVRITVDGTVETANGYSTTGTIDTDGMTVVFTNVYNTPVTPPSSEETDPTDPPTDPTDPPTDPTDPSDDPDEPKPPTPPTLNGEDHFGYIVGYPGDEYVRPNNPITRAELVSILFRLLKDEVREQYRPEPNYVYFRDVNRQSWYSLAVGTLTNMGIISGYGDGTFRPDRFITRAEMAVIVSKFFENSDDTYFSDFTDVPQDAWYARYVAFVNSIGIMVGNGDGTFNPNAQLSRAQAMAVFNRLLGRTPTSDSFEKVADTMKTWVDNADPSVWYYADVQEATNSHEFEIVDGVEVWTEITEMIDWTKLNESYQYGN